MALGRWLGALGRLLAAWRPVAPPAHIEPGARVRLRSPLATPHKVWIPAGAAGIVVGWDTPGRRVSIELDTPRTVVTVPWSWVEAEPPPAPPDAAAQGGPPG
jgi:hypothetical protein